MNERPPLNIMELLLNNAVALANSFTTLDFNFADQLFNQGQYRLQVSTTVNGYQVIPKAGNEGWSFYFLLLLVGDPTSWRIYVSEPTRTSFLGDTVLEVDFTDNGYYDYLYINEPDGFSDDYRLPVLPGDSLCLGATKEALNVVIDLNAFQDFKVALVDGDNNIVNSNIGGLTLLQSDTAKTVTFSVTSPLSKPELATKYIGNLSTCDLPCYFAYLTVNGVNFFQLSKGRLVSDIEGILSDILLSTPHQIVKSTNLQGFDLWTVTIEYGEFGLEDLEQALCVPVIDLVVVPNFWYENVIVPTGRRFQLNANAGSIDVIDVQESGIYTSTLTLEGDENIVWVNAPTGYRSLLSYLTTDELTTWCFDLIKIEDAGVFDWIPSYYETYKLAGWFGDYQPLASSTQRYIIAANGIDITRFNSFIPNDDFAFAFTMNASVAGTSDRMVANRQGYSISQLDAEYAELFPTANIERNRKLLGAISANELDIEVGSIRVDTITWAVDKDYIEQVTFPLIVDQPFQPMIFEGVKLHAGFEPETYLMNVSVQGCNPCYPFALVCVDIPGTLAEGCYRLLLYEDQNSIVPLAISDVFEYRDKGEATKMLEFTDNQGAFGFKYDQGQAQKLRLNLFIGQPENIVNETVYRQSNGVHRFGQVAIDKQLTVNTLWQPEKFHEAFYFAVKHQTLKLANKTYICVSEYTTETPLDNSTSEGYNELSVGQFKVVAQGFAPLKNLPSKCN